jgi:hypothetical protein
MRCWPHVVGHEEVWDLLVAIEIPIFLLLNDVLSNGTVPELLTLILLTLHSHVGMLIAQRTVGVSPSHHPSNRVRLASYWEICLANSLKVHQAAMIHFSPRRLGCQSLCFTLISFSLAEM